MEKKVILVLGQRGSGKSYCARQLIMKYPRYIIYDTLGEYLDMGVICDSLPVFKDTFLKLYQKNNFKIVYQPLNPAVDFNAVCDLVYKCGEVCFLVEEIDTFCSSFDISNEFANILQRGRHRDITLIGVSQRPYGINRLITSQAKTIYSFAHREPRDIDYLKMFIGSEAEKIKELPQYHYLKWDDGAITTGKM